ncbi:hypothetical protein AT864_01323 [Anoxybacillus sp. P3H1B]|nr:hypothetical protein AT864_01323 [Anoxybacillus sp. P3H1B]
MPTNAKTPAVSLEQAFFTANTNVASMQAYIVNQ